MTEDPETQINRFIITARAVGADKDEGAFKAKLAQIAKQKPTDKTMPSKEEASGEKCDM